MQTYAYSNAGMRICLDSRDGKEFSGSILTPYRKEKTEFYNVVSLLVELEAILEERGFPDASCIRRSFYSKKENVSALSSGQEIPVYHTMEELNRECGRIETLLVYVTGRKNAGIQGQVVFESDGTRHDYRSELELIKICDEKINNSYR